MTCGVQRARCVFTFISKLRSRWRHREENRCDLEQPCPERRLLQSECDGARRAATKFWLRLSTSRCNTMATWVTVVMIASSTGRAGLQRCKYWILRKGGAAAACCRRQAVSHALLDRFRPEREPNGAVLQIKTKHSVKARTRPNIAPPACAASLRCCIYQARSRKLYFSCLGRFAWRAESCASAAAGAAGVFGTAAPGR